ncbi:energy-coupling factor transporter transmembrane component T [uncultured Limosilactobacillus sp.]|uniref:energy-coupling factor transporter transmembrane component T n=1 Tax=uncultured Limosilactobacillus sp. TaxID=2837629 RepID=UPI0025D0A480|nr:energy-coupling factor transporter transmembrane component T [uncultured Limosilactobacillus sp.]
MHKSRGLNPTTLVLLIISIGLCTSFIRSVTMNVAVIICSLAYLVLQRASFRKTALILLIALPLAMGSWLSFYFFGTGDRWHVAWIYGSRVFAYLTLALTLTLTASAKMILFSLHEHLRLSNTFVYGVLAALNMFHRLRSAFQQVRYSAMLRGRAYHFWQPRFYLRLIIIALNWSGDLAMAMTSQGFTEGADRTELTRESLPWWQLLLVVMLLGAYLGVALGTHPW